MPNYIHVIGVDDGELREILSTFNDLVSDKFFKPIPYKDFTHLKKNKQEVEIRFSPEDGSILIVPTDHRLSMLWWGKRGDNSFADFLWGHFEEELKSMHPEKEEKVVGKMYYDACGMPHYDIFGDCQTIVTAADATVKTVIDGICATHATELASACSTADATKISSDYYYDSNRATSATPLQWEDNSWKAASTVIDSNIEKVKEEIDELKVDIKKTVQRDEMDYILHEFGNDILSEVDEAKYDIAMLNERIEALEKKEKAREEAKVFTVKIQGTSSNCYPGRDIKLKGDIASADVCSDDRKEKENMETKMFNFDFGPATNIHMSPYGMAVRNHDGKFVSYDRASGNIMDVEVFNFNAEKFMWKMPVAIKDIAVGDIVVHMRKPMFVTAVNGNRVSVVDIYNAEVKDILPVKSPFGFDFITKVVSLVDFGNANSNNPFGNVLPFLLMSDGDKDMKDILPFMLMNGNNNAFNNPMMLYALMGDGNKDMLPFLFMMNGNAFGAPAANNCGDRNDGQCHNG